MDVVVTGSHGFIASALIPALERAGQRVVRVVRREARGTDELSWDPVEGRIDAEGLEGIDVVVHLAGEGIGDKRWTEQQKKRILESRTKGTSLLASALAGLKSGPKVMVSASAIGYYGDRGDEMLTEDSPPGTGFAADVCVQWEASAQPAVEAGIRVVHPRSGIVLDPRGGALKKMLIPFRLGIGGRFGSGRQWFSWISLDDEVAGILHLIANRDMRGPVNLTAPKPVTNADLTKTLGKVLHRPTVLPTPMFVVKAVLGSEAVDEGLLAGQRVLPQRLQASGFRFRAPELEAALRGMLK
jgi:hypothetical protein